MGFNFPEQCPCGVGLTEKDTSLISLDRGVDALWRQSELYSLTAWLPPGYEPGAEGVALLPTYLPSTTRQRMWEEARTTASPSTRKMYIHVGTY
jgi:hypothetical protein